MSSIDEYLKSVRESLHRMHPSISHFPDIAVRVTQVVAYEMWRKQRVYDHLEIVFGARTPDGAAGFTLTWHDEPEAGRTTGVVLTRTELEELVSKAMTALGEEKGHGSALPPA